MIEKLYISPRCLTYVNSSPFLFQKERIKVNNALFAFENQKEKDEKHEVVDNLEASTYRIMTFQEYLRDVKNTPKEIRTLTNRFDLIFLDDEELAYELKRLKPDKYQWKWKYSEESPGYEVTTRGDRRFSPFCMKFITADGSVISEEEYFQKIMKPMYESGQANPGDGWGHRIFKSYLADHQGLFYELALIGKTLPFTDMFDKDGGQNKFWAEILNEYYGFI